MKSLPLVMAITGASGAPYALRLIEQLLAAERQVHLMISAAGRTVLSKETGVEWTAHQHGTTDINPNRLWTNADGAPWWRRFGDGPYPAVIEGRGLLRLHQVHDYMSPVASGSFLTAAMVICPCSGGTLSGVVHGSSGNLIERAAEVHLKEQRKIILVPRETPLSHGYLRNLQLAAEAGAVVLPAMPGWYHGVATVFDLIDFVVARVLDQLAIPHSLMYRWGGEAADA